MLKLIKLIILLGIAGSCYAQQDTQYSQYIFNGIYINPAYAGFRERVNINATYRNQWTGVEDSPESFSLAADALMPNGRVGLSLMVNAEQLGPQKNITAFGNYAYRMPLNEEGTTKLAFGLGLGFRQAALNGEMLKPKDLGDNFIPNGTIKQILPDMNAGVFFSTPSIYVGAAVNNLIGAYVLQKKSLEFNFPTPRPHFYLTGGALIPIEEYVIDFKPFFLIKDDLKGPTMLDINAFLLFKQKVWLGVGYRTGVKLYEKPNLPNNINSSNALIGMTELFVNQRFRLGYSYDHNLSSLSGYAGATHEISLSWNFFTEKERRLNFCYF
jgi:type IX secretion system PorP/SprF family membrane protein